MTFIIVCLVCCVLILAVVYLARRHMQKVRQTCDATSEKEHVSISDLEVMARSYNVQRRYDAESQRTRRIAICSIAIIIVVGAAVAVFDSYKKKLLDGWFAMFAKQNVEKVETVENSDGKPLSTPVSEYKFSDVEKKQEASDKKQHNSKVVEEAENLKNKLSFGNWFAAQFSYEKALEYYGAKRIAAVYDAEAEYKKCEIALKEAKLKQDNGAITFQKAYLENAKVELNKARKDVQNLSYFLYDLKDYFKLNWLFVFLVLIGILDVFCWVKRDKWENSILEYVASACSLGVFFISYVVFIMWMSDDYKGGMIFTIRDGIGIVFAVWCLCFSVYVGGKNQGKM